MPKVPVASDKGNVVIDATLCDQGIGESGTPAFRNQAGAEQAGSFPESVQERQYRHFPQEISEPLRQSRITEHLAQDDRGQNGLLLLQGRFHCANIPAPGAFEVGNQ